MVFLGILMLCICVSASPASDALAACNKLNFTMKTSLMGGYGTIDGYSRNSGCADVCGRLTFRWDNGPQGFGDNTKPGTSTQWPSTLNMASTFDADLALEWGTAMGEEFWGKGTNIQEGPGINIARNMVNGRTFEYVSGEDPWLGSALVVPIIEGIQQNVMSISKHYIANNQEYDRHTVNEVVDEQTLMELYAVPFAAAAQKTTGYMCSYNLVNGVYACENHRTLKTMLKGYYNFTGFVVSDWGATHSTGMAIASGLDIEMPHANYFTEANIKKAIDNKEITMDDIDDTCVRILSGYYTVPEDKRHPCGGGICIDKNVSTAAHKALARKLSSMSTVLLKNDGKLLPLPAGTKQKIALIGLDADQSYTGGQGSGSVVTNAVISPLSYFGSMGLNVHYEEGKTSSSAAAAAKDADIAIVFASAHSGEGHDRKDLNLGGDMDSIIPAVAAAQKNTIVVMTVPGNILTDWRDHVPVILTNFLPGEQVGPGLFDILFGIVPPQAKLPLSFPNKENEQGFSKEQYPGVPAKPFALQANYTEKQIVGYRWYDKHGVKAAYPFGHGLSYASFTYSDLSTSGRTIAFKLTREAGTTMGCDTPQVYISFPAADTDPHVPAKVMRFFKKTCQSSASFSFTLKDADVSNWSVSKQKWEVTRGTYKVHVGSSSQDIRLEGRISI